MYPTCTHPQRHGVLGHAAAGNGGSVKLHRKWHPSLSSHTALLGTHAASQNSCMDGSSLLLGWRMWSAQMGISALQKALSPWRQAWTLLGVGKRRCYLHLATIVQTVRGDLWCLLDWQNWSKPLCGDQRSLGTRLPVCLLYYIIHACTWLCKVPKCASVGFDKILGFLWLVWWRAKPMETRPSSAGYQIYILN